MPNDMTKIDDGSSHDKPCTLCGTPRSVLVRCQIDETAKWHFVCPGKCWISVSGGVEDAKGHKAEHPYYRYGGMWKNKHADGPVSAKKPKKVKDRQKRLAAKKREEADKTDTTTSGSEDDASTEIAGVEVGVEAEAEAEASGTQSRAG